MTRFHISAKTNAPARCSAKEGNCPLGGGDAPHFDTKEAAQAYTEKVNAQKFGTVPSKKKMYASPTARKLMRTIKSNGSIDDTVEALRNYTEANPVETDEAFEDHFGTDAAHSLFASEISGEGKLDATVFRMTNAEFAYRMNNGERLTPADYMAAIEYKLDEKAMNRDHGTVKPVYREMLNTDDLKAALSRDEKITEVAKEAAAIAAEKEAAPVKGAKPEIGSPESYKDVYSISKSARAVAGHEWTGAITKDKGAVSSWALPEFNEKASVAELSELVKKTGFIYKEDLNAAFVDDFKVKFENSLVGRKLRSGEGLKTTTYRHAAKEFAQYPDTYSDRTVIGFMVALEDSSHQYERIEPVVTTTVTGDNLVASNGARLLSDEEILSSKSFSDDEDDNTADLVAKGAISDDDARTDKED